MISGIGDELNEMESMENNDANEQYMKEIWEKGTIQETFILPFGYFQLNQENTIDIVIKGRIGDSNSFEEFEKSRIAKKTNDIMEYYHTDHLGSTRQFLWKSKKKEVITWIERSV